MSAATNPWLPRRRSRDARLRLFCFPCAGGGSAQFHGLSRHVAEEIEVVPLHLPGRERRLGEPPARDLETLLDALEGALEAELGTPHAFLGHSLGSLVAFELTRRRLARGSRAPAHLFVCACRAPQRVAARDPIAELPDEPFLDAVEALGGLPDALRAEPELLQLVLPTLRADFALYERYRFEPGPQLELPLTVLGGEHDRAVPRSDLEAWRERTRGPAEVLLFAGGHFFVQEQPAPVAALVNARLAPLVEAAS